MRFSVLNRWFRGTVVLLVVFLLSACEEKTPLEKDSSEGSGTKKARKAKVKSRRIGKVKASSLQAGECRSVKGIEALNKCWLPAGRFMMGSSKTEAKRDKDEYWHEVFLNQGFWSFQTEVTQGQFKAVMGYNPSHFKACGDDCPVEQVNWHQAVAFADKLSKQNGYDSCYRCEGEKENVRCQVLSKYKGKPYYSCPGYRLPTEAEWEYAYRGGASAPFFTGSCLSAKQANYDGNYPYKGCPRGEFRKSTMKAKSLPKNKWGLYHLAGNVQEWVFDVYGSYRDRPKENPIQAVFTDRENFGRVVRGGSWSYVARWLRAANRSRWSPDWRSDDLGFRLVKNEDPIKIKKTNEPK